MNTSKKKKSIISFYKKHPIISHLILIVVAFVVFINVLLICIDIFTEHGEYKVVPTLKNLTLDQAIAKVEAEGFKWDISDSIYSDDFRPGVVVEQNPKENSKIKSNRIIYIVINAFTPRVVTIPNVIETSERQAVSLLEGLGLKNVRVETAYSPYKGLVIDCRINGHSVQAGSKVSSSAFITLVVGDGAESGMSADSLAADSAVIDDFGDNSVGVDFM